MVVSKEYRIPLPLTCDEYRIAQLYMLAKKSRQESHGEGSGVEILVNEPYENGPGPDGKGQYTHKVYHVGSHLPGWLKSLIPKSALSVEEEAWNAYPYTKTRFTCPFVEKFSIEVETYYFNDGGHQDNVFSLSKSDLKQREVDLIDVVRDQLYGADYKEEEDPRRYISQKTGRGPLEDNWIEEYWGACKGKEQPRPDGKAIMCAYKLCRVEFRYWGMQSKIEKFIHDIALRKTMLRAHRQAWAWMDEWWGLTIEDIRSIEQETQALLAKKYGNEGEDEAEAEEGVSAEEVNESHAVPDLNVLETPVAEQMSTYSRTSDDASSSEHTVTNDEEAKCSVNNSHYNVDHLVERRLSGSPKLRKQELNVSMDSVMGDELRKKGSWSRSGSRNTLNSQSPANWRMESIRRDSASSESEDEFFDCQGSAIPIIKEDLEENTALNKWSSLELLPQDAEVASPAVLNANSDSIFSHAFMSRMVAERQRSVNRSMEASAPSSPSLSPSHQPGPCSTTVLLLVVHAGSVLDPSTDVTAKKSDIITFRGAFESVMRQHYPQMVGHVAIRLVVGPTICGDGLNVLSSLSPYGIDASPVGGEVTCGDNLPVGAIPLMATSAPEYEESVLKLNTSLNAAYHEFLRSEEGHGFNGQVCLIGDSVGGILCYDVLCRGHDQPGKFGSSTNIPEGEPPSPGQYCQQKTPPGSSLPKGMHSPLSPPVPPISCSSQAHQIPSPVPSPSPTIRVSFEDALSGSHMLAPVSHSETSFSGHCPVGLQSTSSSPSSTSSSSSSKAFYSEPCTVAMPSQPIPIVSSSTVVRKISGSSSTGSRSPCDCCPPACHTLTHLTSSSSLCHSSSSSFSSLPHCHHHNHHHHHQHQHTSHQRLSYSLEAPQGHGELTDAGRGGAEDGDVPRSYRKCHSDPNHIETHTNRLASESDSHYSRHLSAPYPRRRSSSSSPQRRLSSSSDQGQGKLDFEVSDFFTFGCPLALVLVYRKMMNTSDKSCLIQRPACHQVYNLFHPTDPMAVRLEPLISARFSFLPPVTISRYTKYPLGDGQPTHLLECIQAHGGVFLDMGPGPAGNSNGSPSLGPPGHVRRMSDASILSTISGMADTVPLATINALSQRWWGNKRLDYALYCPEGLANFPVNALPHLFHASYWESSDVIGFILRQLVRTDHSGLIADDKDLPVFSPAQPREKWIKKRTAVKIKNLAANHRGNDVIIREGAAQVVQARFMYGPLDMVALTGERVDVHIMQDPPGGDWLHLTTEQTDKNGRVIFNIPSEKALSYGMYPVKMVVRGDHTSCTMYLAVVPPKTECVVFSIDGSFAASVSVTGRDPKVRAGAVDVVRHWQELGYLIIYVTARPDMQQQRVVSWLAQHNFPHGLVSFAEGFSKDPIGLKADYLRGLMNEAGLVIQAAYGSSKDISVYTAIGLSPEQIYIVGKANKKQHSLSQVLSDGYAAHLAHLSALGKSRPARGNPQIVIPRGFFGLPGQSTALRRRRSAKRTTSFPVLSTSEGVLRSRGSSHSPRPNHMSMRC
ncbi:retinal degeneration B isoform X3 [Oratosquilla oratoria]|uniref:retinal degeneration B isoform X3 n=1 Tax=Oratosquilla oratoria TaxID=337810 RepID=UPI003F773381